MALAAEPSAITGVSGSDNVGAHGPGELPNRLQG